MRFLSAVIVFLFVQVAVCQQEKYDSLVKLAARQLSNRSYELSADLYLSAFKSLHFRGFAPDRFNAAKAMAMSGKSDSAFQYLNILWNKTEYIDKDSLLNEKLLSPLWSDSRWDKLIFQTTPKMPEIAQKLSEIRIKDQESRQKLNAAQAKFGKDSKEYRSHLSKLNAEDSVNQLYVVDLLDKHGWLGRQDIGNSGCTALFNVFLHASIEVQEKYLPVMKAAVKEGKARKQNHAYLEDRVLVRRNKKQLYGSQLKAGGSVYYPILDVKNLNERRSYVGLAAFDDVEMAEIMRQSQSWK